MQMKQKIIVQSSNTVKKKLLITLSEVLYVQDPQDIFNWLCLLITALLEIHEHF